MKRLLLLLPLLVLGWCQRIEKCSNLCDWDNIDDKRLCRKDISEICNKKEIVDKVFILPYSPQQELQ